VSPGTGRTVEGIATFDAVLGITSRRKRFRTPGCPPYTRLPLKKWLKTKAEGRAPKMAISLMRDHFGLDTRKPLKEAKVPVRCINSAGGYKSFIPTVVETNKKYADFGVVTIEGVGHYPMLEKAEEFNRKLRDVPKEFATRK
jgi:pimeloyl-ACP methyl ester carboxylesterase